LVPTVLGSFYVDRFFKIPAIFASDARILFFMVGLSLALRFPLGVAGGILEGLQSL
jgi:hypothetical protein